MKKHIFILSTLVLFAFCSCSKNPGETVTRTISIDGSYTKLQVENAFDVTVSDTASHFYITTGENVMSKVVVELDDNELKIYLKPFTGYFDSDMKVVIPYNADLKHIEMSGASEFHSEFGLKGKKIEVELSGASKFDCDIDATEFDLELSGASDASLTGQATKFEIDLSGASNILKKVVDNRYSFSCDRCDGSISGASIAYIHCDGSIKVNLSGASDLHYTGNASTSGCSTSGSSNVIHDNP